MQTEKSNKRSCIPRGRYKKYLINSSPETPSGVPRQTRWSWVQNNVQEINVSTYLFMTFIMNLES